MMIRIPRLLALFATGFALSAAQAEEKVLNLYSARHYQTDEALFSNFTKQTGIALNRIDAREDEMRERVRNDGPATPAALRPSWPGRARLRRRRFRRLPRRSP